MVKNDEVNSGSVSVCYDVNFQKRLFSVRT